MTYQTSGRLVYREVKGLHRTDDDWWIDLGWLGSAFTLHGPDGNVAAYMTNHGRLIVARGYLWDGSSGPTLDGIEDPIPSLVHDVLYEAFRAGKLARELRGKVDKLYFELLRERGMGVIFTRPSAWYKPWELFRGAGMRWFGLRIGAWYAARRRPEYIQRSAA